MLQRFSCISFLFKPPWIIRSLIDIDLINSMKKWSEWYLLVVKMGFGKEIFVTLNPDFLNILTLLSWGRLMIGVRLLYKRWSKLNELWNCPIRFENIDLQIFLKIDDNASCHVISGWRTFFDLTKFYVQWEMKFSSFVRFFLIVSCAYCWLT